MCGCWPAMISSMELARTDAEALYNCHISWRRLRGVKINPIYQESDICRHGDGTDTQSDTSVPVGEIQIEMYESLPRHRLVRPSRSAPNFSQSHLNSVTTVPYVSSDQKIDSEIEAKEDTQQPFNCSLPESVDGDEDDDFYNESEDPGILKWRNEKNEGSGTGQTRKNDLGHRKQFTRQSGIDATSGDSDAIEIAYSTSSVSESSSSSLTSSCSPQISNSRIKRRATPKYVKTKNDIRKKQLSVVQEQSSIMENEHATDADDEETATTELDENDDEYIVPASDAINGQTPCHKDVDNHNVNEKTCHTVSHSKEKYDNSNNIQSINNLDTSLVNNIWNRNDKSYNMDSPIIPPKEDILQSPLSKAMHTLDKIAMMPSYSHIHNTSPVGSFDYINNNNQRVPDLMLQHNGRLNGISRNGGGNGFVKQVSGYDGDECITWDAHDIAATYSLSNTNFLDSESNSLGKEVIITDCDCGGRPTLKCFCGRKALQKLLGDKYISKCSEDDWQHSNSKPVPEDITRTPTKCNDQTEKPPVRSIRSNQSENDISEITEYPLDESPKQKILPLKSILHGALSPKRIVSTLERRGVTFSQDTIFNENKGAIYLKECISPSDLALLVTELQNDDDGLDNPTFEWEDGSQIADPTKNKKSKKRSKSKNKIASNESLILKVSELNAPTYMQHYLNGVNGCDAVHTEPDSNGKRAPPVSIEAIGGSIIYEPSCSEIGLADDDEFEDYRTRRKLKYSDDENIHTWLKKSRRQKKIKICAIVITVISLVITGIALAIHFGAPHAGSLPGGSTSSAGSFSGLPVW